MISNPAEISGFLGNLQQQAVGNARKAMNGDMGNFSTPGLINRSGPLTGNPESDSRHFDIEVGQVGESFSQALQKAIQGVDNTMKTSDKGVQDFVSGKTDNIHEVMINMQRAQLSFQLLTQVRNKAIETYNEISRMQI
tara:strand:+ start:194125 stop:194538 length:414 start_codon:yes stop_codon:yes gene_type:complete